MEGDICSINLKLYNALHLNPLCYLLGQKKWCLFCISESPVPRTVSIHSKYPTTANRTKVNIIELDRSFRV